MVYAAVSFTIQKEPDLTTARELMFNDRYMQEKASIMKPLEEAQRMIAERTEQEAAAASTYKSRIFLALQCMLGFLLAMILLVSKQRRQGLEKEIEARTAVLHGAFLLGKNSGTWIRAGVASVSIRIVPASRHCLIAISKYKAESS